MAGSEQVTGPRPLSRDSRGIVGADVFARTATLNRYPAPEPLAGLVSQFWAVRWALPEGTEHHQQVLTHPCANISVGSTEERPEIAEARVYGVAREINTRRLHHDGWTVAAMTRPGGIGAFLAASAQDLTGRVVGVDEAFGIDESELLTAMGAAGDEVGQVRVLSDALAGVLERADPDRVADAHDVAGVARLAETDRGLRRVEQLAEAAGVGVRTLQRMFREYAGVSPTWVLRRYRLLDAAERVRDGRPVAWAELARELGFSDQAHLVREFRAALGQTPAAYARARRAERPGPERSDLA